ncbi:MAG: phosphotransferase, partial [Nocardioides sp.]
MARPTPPIADTARRLEWHVLPRPLRDLIERRCGSPVVSAHTRNRGFTPGFASVLECEDGSRHFVKAASLRAQGTFAHAYREEARTLQALPEELPAPRLLWSYDGEWVALGIEHVDGRHPLRPWTDGDLDACLDALETVADRLTPAPEVLELDPAAIEFAPFLLNWDDVRAARPDLPHLDEAVALAELYADVVAGDSVVHTDVRDDNVLIDTDGRAWFCDWNWPVVGAAWLDSLL